MPPPSASGLELEIHEGIYGNYQQEILDPDSGLYAFRPDLVVILVNHRDLGLPPAGGKDRAAGVLLALPQLVVDRCSSAIRATWFKSALICPARRRGEAWKTRWPKGVAA